MRTALHIVRGLTSHLSKCVLANDLACVLNNAWPERKEKFRSWEAGVFINSADWRTSKKMVEPQMRIIPAENAPFPATGQRERLHLFPKIINT